MPQHPPALPPDIPGTEADDIAYIAQFATVPLIKTKAPLFILAGGVLMALASVITGAALSLGASDLPEDARRERYDQAWKIAWAGLGVTTSLLSIGSTALQFSNGTSDTPRPLHRPYPAPSPQYPPQEMAGAPPDVGLWEERGGRETPEPPDGRPMGFRLPVEEIVDIRFDPIGQRQVRDIFEYEDPECFGAELS
jgi:hypothetical protein